MNSFKSGSGNLDFGEGDDTEDDESPSEPTTGESGTADAPGTESGDHSTSKQGEESSVDSDSETDGSAERESASGDTSATNKYPYFVRRNNVGDERDNRLEIHVRDKVIEQEAEFRNELAEELGTGDIAKTDAREFALIAAFQNPEHIAEQMREEGFGELG